MGESATVKISMNMPTKYCFSSHQEAAYIGILHYGRESKFKVHVTIPFVLPKPNPVSQADVEVEAFLEALVVSQYAFCILALWGVGNPLGHHREAPSPYTTLTVFLQIEPRITVFMLSY